VEGNLIMKKLLSVVAVASLLFAGNVRGQDPSFTGSFGLAP
jgi:hypothetical protein